MPILRFDHYAIRTERFDECRKFYCEILEFVEGPRPPLSVEGIWFYSGAAALVHIVDISERGAGTEGAPSGPASGRKRRAGFVDHVAFRATGLRQMRDRLNASQIRFHESSIPSLELHQLFIEDPDGVVIELNYSIGDAETHGE